MLLTGSVQMDAERAFARQSRARRRATLARWLKRGCGGRLPVYDETTRRVAGIPARVELPIDAITGTVEPSRSVLFDRAFRPAKLTRGRWERVWMAEHRGTVLPPISVVRVRDGYAVRDGHHRVSVARARGALTIDAAVEAGWMIDSTTHAPA
jgi:hypothetical protein